MKEPTKYAGHEWLERQLKVTLPTLGRTVADIVGQVARGIYHLEDHVLASKWDNPRWVDLRWPGNMLASVDSAHLTELVVLCHVARIRLSIAPRGPRHLTLRFTRREISDDVMTGCPSIQEAVERIWDELAIDEICPP